MARRKAWSAVGGSKQDKVVYHINNTDAQAANLMPHARVGAEARIGDNLPDPSPLSELLLGQDIGSISSDADFVWTSGQPESFTLAFSAGAVTFTVGPATIGPFVPAAVDVDNDADGMIGG